MGPSLVRALLMPKFQGKTLPKTTFCGKIIKYCRRSVKDITQDSGSCNGGSIPSGDVFFIGKVLGENVGLISNRFLFFFVGFMYN